MIAGYNILVILVRSSLIKLIALLGIIMVKVSVISIHLNATTNNTFCELACINCKSISPNPWVQSSSTYYDWVVKLTEHQQKYSSCQHTYLILFLKYGLSFFKRLLSQYQRIYLHLSMKATHFTFEDWYNISKNHLTNQRLSTKFTYSLCLHVEYLQPS